MIPQQILMKMKVICSGVLTKPMSRISLVLSNSCLSFGPLNFAVSTITACLILSTKEYLVGKEYLYSLLSTSEYKTRSKLPTPWDWNSKLISDPVIFSDPMGKLFKIKLATLAK